MISLHGIQYGKPTSQAFIIPISTNSPIDELKQKISQRLHTPTFDFELYKIRQRYVSDSQSDEKKLQSTVTSVHSQTNPSEIVGEITLFDEKLNNLDLSVDVEFLSNPLELVCDVFLEGERGTRHLDFIVKILDAGVYTPTLSAGTTAVGVMGNLNSSTIWSVPPPTYNEDLLISENINIQNESNGNNTNGNRMSNGFISLSNENEEEPVMMSVATAQNAYRELPPGDVVLKVENRVNTVSDNSATSEKNIPEYGNWKLFKSRKYSILFIILGVIIGLALAGVGIYFATTSGKPTNSSSSSSTTSHLQSPSSTSPTLSPSPTPNNCNLKIFQPNNSTLIPCTSACQIWSASATTIGNQTYPLANVGAIGNGAARQPTHTICECGLTTYEPCGNVKGQVSHCNSFFTSPPIYDNLFAKDICDGVCKQVPTQPVFVGKWVSVNGTSFCGCMVDLVDPTSC